MNSLISFGSVVNLPDDPGFATYFSHLLKTKTYTDVTFILDTPEGTTEIRAHQLILAMRSPDFADMFYGDGKMKEYQVIPLRKVNFKAFEAMIKYCYGCKPGLEAADEVCGLFKVANQFNVMSLMTLCREFLRTTKITPRNVFTMLELSVKMKDNSLRDMCHKLLGELTREVMASYELQDLTQTMVYTILDLPKLSLYSEYELIKWLFDWAKVKSEEDDSIFESARDYLQKLVQDMNFLALTFEEFAKLCKDYPDFFNSNEIASIFVNIAFPGTREMPDWYDKDLKIRAYTGSKTLSNGISVE